MGETKKTIFHISDIHIGEDGVGTDDFRQIIDSIENRAAHVTSPLLLITGDLTAEGLREEYEEFAGVVEGLSVPMVVIPGNHD
ncbi:MAG: metallophosphoesterase family protein, partial [Candidatus Hermodarchaeota archaeon]